MVDLTAYHSHGHRTLVMNVYRAGLDTVVCSLVHFVLWRVSDVDGGGAGCRAGISEAASIPGVFREDKTKARGNGACENRWMFDPVADTQTAFDDCDVVAKNMFHPSRHSCAFANGNVLNVLM